MSLRLTARGLGIVVATVALVVLAIPDYLLALLAVNIGVGALSRATPSLNVFAVGFAVSLLVGFSLLFLLVPVIAERITELWQQAEAFMRARLVTGPQ